ncbi:MAG: Flp family type IVb pilin [Chloroflexi bacterium]|nr:Flp family type IVb pilin [Chloroflexota bacterium]
MLGHDAGQALVEYGLVIVLVVLVAVGGVSFFGNTLWTALYQVSTAAIASAI